MKLALFCHSLISDWNNGNAHFLRGLATELRLAGHFVRAFEPADAWSVQNLLASQGSLRLADLRRHYPFLEIERYAPATFDLDRALDGFDLVLVHEWNSPDLIGRIAALRARPGSRFRVLFHDTHHRSVSDSRAIAELGLSGFDGVLAFGEAVRERYLAAGWGRRVWTFHEAADTRIFQPFPELLTGADLLWIGNYGDEERTAELHEYLLEPARNLRLSGTVYGVRYPESGVRAVEAAGLNYGGWLPNYLAPRMFARHRMTVHVPRRPYAERLPGIPTIRMFEALAAGIPLLSAPWNDCERLFRDGDYLSVRSGAAMQAGLCMLLEDPEAARAMARHGRETVLMRHTCRHRAEQLLGIAAELGLGLGAQNSGALALA